MGMVSNLIDTPLNTVMSYTDYERNYPLPNGEAYKAVNGAVAYAIWKLYGVSTPNRDSVDGGTKYTIITRDGFAAQVFVLYISEKWANVRFSLLVPTTDELETWAEQRQRSLLYTGLQLAAFMSWCHDQIATQLQRAVALDETTVPAPSANDLKSVIMWQDTYHPKMKDRELADLVGVAEQTIRNTRYELAKDNPTFRREPKQKSTIRGKIKK